MIIFMGLKQKVQAVVTMGVAQDRLAPTQVHGQDWELSAAQTPCQLFHKGMHLPQNSFPQMDNPCTVTGSFPQDFKCSWKGEFPAASPRLLICEVSPVSRTPLAGLGLIQRTDSQRPRLEWWISITWDSASSAAAAAPREALAGDTEETLHTHQTQQNTANSHYKLLSNYSPVPLCIWEAKKIKSQ